MDACDPGINIGNLKRLVKQNTGLELDLTREQICDAYSSIQDGKLPLPPMVLSKDGKYMLDRKSPLTGKDFEVLFGSDSTVSQLKRVARKAGLASYDNMTKAEMVEAIESTLQSKNIREPIRLHISAQRAVRKVSVNNNNNYPNNLNVNNANGNGVRNNNNLRKIANESNNLNRGNGNRNGNGNNLAKIANESRNLNRGNGNRGNENRGNGNRGNGNRGNGNRGNGNRGNERPSINRTTARYVNAMLRKPNARRNEDLARVLSAARNTGGGSTQNLSRIIEAVRRKPSTDGSTATMLNKLMRAKTSGNSNALQRAMKAIEELKHRPVAARVNNKQQKLAELEKYAVNKASKLGNQRLQFMNEAQKHIKAYKNGEYGSEFAKKQIFIRYDQIYKKRLNDMGFNEAATNLQKSTINAIGNTKIKSKAVELLEEYKKTGSTPIRNSIIKLKSLDENLRSKEDSVVKLFGNRKPLNSERDEALQNIQSYNMRNGLAKINKQIEEKKKERGVEFNTMIVNATYKNVPSNVKTTLRNKYVSGELNRNDVKRGLNKALKKTTDILKNLENKIKKLENELGDSKLTPSERNALKKEVNNLKLKRNTNLKNMNVMREQLGNMKTTVNTKNRNIERLKIKQGNANAEIESLRNKLKSNKNLSNGEKRALEEQLKNAMKNRANINERLSKSESEKEQYMREMNTLAGNVRNITKQKENANAEIESLRNKLKSNKNLSNGEKRALEEQLKNAMKNRANINERLSKSESEKEQYMREMNTLAGNVINITKQKENANKEIANLRNKLQKNKNLSNGEKRALEEQLKNAMINRANLNTRLRKSEAEKMQYMQEMYTLAGNVRNITKQKENANAQITAKNREINQIKKNMAAAGSMSMAQKEKLRQNLEKAQQEKANISNQLSRFRSELEMAKKRLDEERKIKGDKIQSLEFNATKARQERNNLKQKRNVNLKNMNVMREQLGNLKVNRNVLAAEAQRRQNALNEAAKKETEITKKLGESNASIKKLTAQRDELLEKGELNAAEKANLQRIRNELKAERNTKNNEIKQLQTLSNNREKELEKISTNLNVATRELNRSMALISTQEKSLEAKNKNLKARQNQVGELYEEQKGLKKLIETLETQATEINEQIQQQTKKLANSASEINRLQKQLNNATEARARNIQTMQMRHAENIGAATAQIEELTKKVQERNAIIKRSKVVGKWQGTAVRGLGTQLRNTRTNLTRAQKEIGVARGVVSGLRRQRQNLQGQRNTLFGKLTQVRGQRRNAQRGINALRAQTRNLEQRRLAENRSTNNTFNASAAFNRQMKGVAARQRWQSLKPKATMVGAAQLGVGKALREKLLKNVDTTNINGKHVVDGKGKGIIPLPGGERRDLKKEVQDPMTGLNRLRAIEKMILNRKTNRNNTILRRRRMNTTLGLAGSAVKNNFSFANSNTPAQSRSQLLKQNNAWESGPAAEDRIRGQAFAS